MAHVSQAKKQEVKKLKELIVSYPNIGIINLTDLPSPQFQSLKAKLKGKVIIRVTKKRLIKIVINDIKDKKKNIEALLPSLKDCMPALLFTKEEPFKLAALLRKNKSKAQAKVGQIAPFDIIIPAGPTPFSPGPIIGELGQAGIKAGIEGGKVVVKHDFTIAEKGDVLDEKAVSLLSKFGIKPMEIGLNLAMLYENGQIYLGETLSIDESVYINNFKKAYNEAIALAIEISYPTKETIELLIKKAALEHDALSSNIEVEEKSKEEIKETKPKEEKKEEKKEVKEEPEKKPGVKPEVKKDDVKEIKKEEVKGEKKGVKIKEKDELTEKERQKKKEEFEKLKSKPPMEYSEEEAKKAQNIIDEMKDKAIKSSQKGG